MSGVETFELKHPRGVTRHFVGEGALEAGLAALAPALAGRTAFAVSSRPILDLHGTRLDTIRDRVRALHVLEIADGEAGKSVAEAERLWRRMAELGGKRDSLVFAFGGGSVGDLAGFAAATFARGLDFVQVPTTLLAQVDAAVGGKTALDLPEAKNAVGAFHHPLAVVAEAQVLATLPGAELRCGLVEVVKMAALLDLELLARVERDLPALLGGDAAALGPVATAASRAKAHVVESDPEERGPRMLLNLGHTLGHALEAELGFSGIRHGDAVAHGLRFALRLSVRQGGDVEFASRLARLLDRLGVPALPEHLAAGALVARLQRDKKARERGLAWVLIDGPGRGRIDWSLPLELARRELEGWLGHRPAESL